jgi:hypothetical protein
LTSRSSSNGLAGNVFLPTVVRFLPSANADEKIVRLSTLLLDGTLQSCHLLQYLHLPSQLAAEVGVDCQNDVGRHSLD